MKGSAIFLTILGATVLVFAAYALLRPRHFWDVSRRAGLIPYEEHGRLTAEKMVRIWASGLALSGLMFLFMAAHQ